MEKIDNVHTKKLLNNEDNEHALHWIEITGLDSFLFPRVPGSSVNIGDRSTSIPRIKVPSTSRMTAIFPGFQILLPNGFSLI